MPHTRKRSGQGVGATEVRPSRPGALSRKGREASYRRSPREREEEYRYRDDERDTFPQFCMACEKQFLPPDDSYLYCSEACREYDATTSHRPPPGNPATDYHPLYVPHDTRPIIPRASPSRPTSTCPPPSYPAPPDAVTALRSLTLRPVSPGGAWPFNSTGGGGYSATYDSAYGRKEYGYGYHNGYAGKYGSSAERPLPKRRPGYPGPKGAELVTPLVGL